MDDGEQDSLHAVLHDNTVLVATTIATLVLAGSALLCRSGRRLSFAPHSGGISLTGPASATDSDPKKSQLKGQGKNAAGPGGDDAKDAKNARSKERRRRGKDPLKEILKGGKKLKMLGVGTRDRDDAGSSTSASTSPLPQTIESGSSQRSASISTSSRSVSSSTASSSGAALLNANITDLTIRGAYDADGVTFGRARGRTQDINGRSAKPHDAEDASQGISEIPDPYSIPISSSSSASTSTALATPATSPDSPSDKSSSGSTVLLPPSQSHPPPSDGMSPWDWDGQGPSSSATTYRKPPRFRSKSRGSPIPPSVSMPYPTSFDFTSTTDPTSFSPHQLSSPSSVSSEDVTFPTLNAPKSTRPILDSAGNGTPRRAPTPRRTPTPSSGGSTPPPSLNTQTQIASLRGALEAARMREEKAKIDLDRFAKDLDMMRWENNTWRRRELDLQAQIHHLMHQLQAYAALFASNMSPHLQIPPNANGNGANGHGPTSPNGYHQHSPGPHQQMLPGMFSQNGMLSPVAVNGQPFFAYPVAPPPPQPPQSDLFAMLFPNGAGAGIGGSGSGSGSGPPSSVSGSSGGSVSPDLVGSPVPASRGRRRTRTQTAEARMATWEGGDEGWVGVEHDGEEADGEADDYEEEESGFSEVLADAILKRPESIKVRSKKARERDKVLEEEQPTEFTFPSLTDFGTGMKGYGERNVHGEPEPAVPNLELGEPEAQVEESMLDTEPRDDAQLPTVQS